MEEQNGTKKTILVIAREKALCGLFASVMEGGHFTTVTCRSRDEAVLEVDKRSPALILLHVDDPHVNPIATMCRVLVKQPVPVLMVTTAPEKVEEITQRGMKLGAVDVLQLPANFSSMTRIQKDRLTRVITGSAMARPPQVSYEDVREVLRENGSEDAHPGPEDTNDGAQPAAAAIQVVGLAISTGGPNALSQFIPSLPNDFSAPVLVVQHIIPGFIESVAERLDNVCSLTVKMAESGEYIQRGTVYFAPDGVHMKVFKANGKLAVLLDHEPSGTLFKPSADILFESIVECCGGGCLGVIMTGMGKDGVKGLRAIKEASGFTMAQDQHSSAIYGMARVAVDANLIDHVVPLNRMANKINSIIAACSSNNSTGRPSA